MLFYPLYQCTHGGRGYALIVMSLPLNTFQLLSVENVDAL